MKNIKLNKVYKLESKKGILLDVNYDCFNHLLLINEKSRRYIIKCLKKDKKITDALNNYCKYIKYSSK